MKRTLITILAAVALLTLPTAPAWATDDAPAQTSAYLYPKLDPSLPASWENSGRQSLLATWDGHSYRPQSDLPLPADLCGTGWGVQEDQTVPGTVIPPVIEKATGEGVLGWPPVVAATHFDVVPPDCAPVIPPQPADVVTVTDGAPVIVCAAPLTTPPTYTVTVTSTRSATTHEWDGTAWVPSDTVTEASSTRTVDAAEAATLGTVPAGCEAVVTPPVVTPEPPVVTPEQPAAPVEPLDQGDDVPAPAVTPALAAKVDRLAETGVDPWVLAFIAVALVAAGAGMWHASQRRRFGRGVDQLDDGGLR